MARLLVSILPHWSQSVPFTRPQSDPFTLCDELTIPDAAMVYCDRHPRPVFWYGKGADNPSPINPREPAGVNEIEKMIGKGATTDSFGSDALENWQKSWSVYCTLVDGIKKGSIAPTKPVYLADRSINPVLTEIPLVAVLDLARQRGDAGEILSSLLTWYEPPELATKSSLATKPTVTTAETGSVEPSSPRQRGPKPGTTGFYTSDRALFPEIEQLQKTGEARSTIAAARILANADKVKGPGTPESRAIRLSRRYGRWKSGATPEG